jgi:hypothetical protein
MNETTVMDPCVECGQSTAFGFGRFVNRLWVDGDGEHIGYQCIECLGSVFDCDRCDEPIPFDEDSIEVILVDRGDPNFYPLEVRVGPCCATTD